MRADFRETFDRPQKNGRPRRFETQEEFAEACDAYFLDCLRSKAVPTFPGWAAFMQMSARALRNYGTRPDFSEEYALQKTRIEAALTQRLFEPSAPVTAILACLNSGFGWRNDPPPDFPTAEEEWVSDEIATRLVADLIAKAQAFAEIPKDEKEQ